MTDEERARSSAQQRALWAARGGHSEETKAKMSAAKKASWAKRKASGTGGWSAERRAKYEATIAAKKKKS